MVAAFIAEPVMQAHGVQIPPPNYFPRVREICDRYDVLLIIDEVITGFGRTGAWFASEHFGIEPDIMTMAKAMTAGYFPMGAAIARKEIVEACRCSAMSIPSAAMAAAPPPPSPTSPSASATASSPRPATTGATSSNGSRSCWPTRRSSAMCAASACGWPSNLPPTRQTKAPFADDTVKAVVRRMKELGVLSSSIGNALEMAPPLIARRDQLDRAAEVTAQAVAEVARARGF